MSEASRAQVRASLAKRRARLRVQGMCVDCGHEKARPDRVLCVYCAANNSRRRFANYTPHPRPAQEKKPKPEKKTVNVDRMIELAFKCRTA
jgi:hypothetical protein